jgi:hypothetical protein
MMVEEMAFLRVSRMVAWKVGAMDDKLAVWWVGA